MKMTTQDYDKLCDLVSNYDTASRRAQYLAGNFPNADKCKDLSMRYRWDSFWMIPLSKRQPFTDTVYRYLDDAHIDTALRNIILPLAPITPSTTTASPTKEPA